MLLGRSDRDVLAVPVLPGGLSAPPARSGPPAFELESSGFSWGRRGLIVAAAAVCLAGIAAGTFLISRSPSHPAAVTTLAPVVVAPPTTTPAVVHHSAQPTPAQLARTTALRIASQLPVAIESTALLRSGTSIYAVGGTTRAGKSSAAEYQINLGTGKVRRIGTFVEPLTGAGAATHAGVLYLAGGWTGQKAGTAVLRWTPGTPSALVARLPVALHSAKAEFSGSTLYVWSGAKVFAVDVAAGSVKSVAKLPAGVSAPGTNLAFLTAAEPH